MKRLFIILFWFLIAPIVLADAATIHQLIWVQRMGRGDTLGSILIGLVAIVGCPLAGFLLLGKNRRQGRGAGLNSAYEVSDRDEHRMLRGEVLSGKRW